MYEINTERFDEITLPSGNGLVILAASQSFDEHLVRLNTALYDRVENRTFNYKLKGREKRFHKRHMKLSWRRTNRTI